MKKSRFLLLLILTLFVFLPNGVKAAVELNKIEGTVVIPTAGEHPVFTADFVITNGQEEVKYEDVVIEWKHVQSDLEMTLEDVFESGEAYAPIIKDYDALISDLETKGYSLSDDCVGYVNGFSMEEYSYFVVDGVDEISLEIVGLNVGNTPNDVAARYNISVGEEFYSFMFGPYEWGMKTDNGVVLMEQDEVFQENIEYVFDWTIASNGTILEGDPTMFVDVTNLMDMRTKLTFANTDISNHDEIVMKPAGRLLKVETKYKNIVGSFVTDKIEEKTEYFTTLFADLEYQLPENIKVLVGTKELKIDEYTYNSTTGKLIIPAELVTDNLTIVAEAVYVPNPDTSDNIFFSILISIVSIVSVVSVGVYLKKEAK